MKTAIEEAIELVKKYDSKQISIKVLFYNLELLLEKEKEQIIDAFGTKKIEYIFNRLKGYDSHSMTTQLITGEEYYNKTYNQNQKNQKYDGVKLKTFIKDEYDFIMPEKEIEARNIIQDLKDRYEKD